MAPNLQPGGFFAIGAAVSAWASIHVILRLWCRRMVKIPYGLDDLWAVLGWIILIGLNVSSGYLYLGGHLKDPTDQISPEAMDIVLKSWYANHIMYFFVMLCCKLSLIFFYLRLFTTGLFRLVAMIVAFFCVAAFVGGLAPFAVQCQPTASTLAPDEPDTCLALPPLFLAINLSNFLTNLLVLLLPLPFVWALNLTVRARMTLSLVFMMGSVACLFSLARVILQDGWLANFDTMVGECSLWTVLEPAVCLFAACLPTLRPLVPRSANMTELTGNIPPEKTSPIDRESRHIKHCSFAEPENHHSKNNSWSSDDSSVPSNVAYAESSHPLDSYGGGFNSIRSSYIPNRYSQDTRPPSYFTDQRSWFDDQDTPPRGIVVRNDVFVDECYSPTPQGHTIEEHPDGEDL